MTKQEIFDTVCSSLIGQGERAVKKRGDGEPSFCRYRHTKDDGTVLKCAVGWLIPDAEYKTYMKDLSAVDIDWFTSRYNFGELAFMDRLRSCHDDASDDNFRSDFVANARALAKRDRLNASVLVLAAIYDD